MASRSPTLDGFRLMLTRPSFGLAEVAWRWSFGASVALLVIFSFVEYLNTLPVTRGDLLFLKTRQPALISQAMLHILRGSGLRLVEVAIVLGIFLAAGWITLATLARAATIKTLLDYFREREAASSQETAKMHLGSLFGLNFFRVGITVAATVGCLAAVLLGGAASPAGNPSPGGALLIFLSVGMLVWLAWSALNWFLSLASVFVVAGGQDTFGAIAAAATLCRNRAGSVFAAGAWFGLAHLAAFVIATSVVAFPLAFARVLPGGMVLGGVLLVTLCYFAVTAFLYAGRLASYVAIFGLPDTPAAAAVLPTWPNDSQRSALSQPGRAVDRDELILSDLPAPG